MSESAEALAATVESRRNVTIEITNLTSNYCLVDPKSKMSTCLFPLSVQIEVQMFCRVFLESGNCHSPPQPTVRPQNTEVCNFSKGKAKAKGAVGVLTYDLFKRENNRADETLAIMFSVPFDYNLYKNSFALGIYKKGKECNESLYKEMYYNKEKVGFVQEVAKGSGLTFEGSCLDIKGTMCPLGRAIMKVEIWDKLFSPQMQQSH